MYYPVSSFVARKQTSPKIDLIDRLVEGSGAQNPEPSSVFGAGSSVLQLANGVRVNLSRNIERIDGLWPPCDKSQKRPYSC
jgi:hypothetical protein